MSDLPKKKKDGENKEPQDAESGYYYDDAHGYETYRPEVDEDEEETPDDEPACVELKNS